MLNKLMDNFEGNLTTSKWAKITKSSQDTALRDITDLVNKGILVKANSGGRSTHYYLKSKDKPELSFLAIHNFMKQKCRPKSGRLIYQLKHKLTKFICLVS